jgi:hypothetical protein
MTCIPMRLAISDVGPQPPGLRLAAACGRDAKPVTPDQVELSRQQTEQRILSLVYYIGTLQ